MGITPFGWQDGPSTATPLDSAELESFGAHIGAYVDLGHLHPTGVKNAAYTLSPTDFVPADASASNVPLVLPTAPADGTIVAAKVAAVNATVGTYDATITCGGSDVFNAAGGSTVLTLKALHQGVVLQYQLSTGIWYVESDDTPLGAAFGAALLGSDGLVGTPGLGGSQLTTAAVSGGLGSPQLVEGFGHSIVYGTGARVLRSAWLPKLARLLGAPDVSNWGVGGAIACHGQVSGQGDGGWPMVLQALSSFRAGGSGASNGAGSGYGYVPMSSVVLLHYGENDIPTLGPSNPTPLLHALTTMVSRICAANMWEDTAGQWTYSGAGWTTNPSGVGQFASGSSLHVDSTVGDYARFTVPADWESGKVLALGLTVQKADNLTVTVRQNGTTITTLTINGAAICDTAPSTNAAYNGVVVRIGATSGSGFPINATVAPGDTWDLQVASVTAGALRPDYAQIEAAPSEGPLIGLMLPHTLVNLTGSSTYAGYAHGPTAGTDPLTNAGILAVKAQIVTAMQAFPNVCPIDPEGTFGQTTPYLFFDSVHPNSRGHAALTQLAYTTLMASGLITVQRLAAIDGTPQAAWRNVGGNIPGSGSDANAPAFGSSSGGTWASLSSSPRVAYRQNLRGEVSLQGGVSTSGTVASPPYTLFSTLPAGARPQSTKTFQCPCVTNATPATVTVDSGGNVKVSANADATGIYLDSVRFLADD